MWVSIAAALLLSGSNQHVDKRASITVHQHFAGIVCAGNCTDSDLQVWSNGPVSFHIRSAGGHSEHNHYRASRDQIRQFWALYAAVRPNGVEKPAHCDEVSPGIYYPFAYDIVWSDPPKSELVACAQGKGSREYFYGLRILGISPEGGPWNHSDERYFGPK